MQSTGSLILYYPRFDFRTFHQSIHTAAHIQELPATQGMLLSVGFGPLWP
jgi:hypothetical protein